MVNEYIRSKLIDFGILQVKIYDSLKDNIIYAKFEKKYKEYICRMKELLRIVTLGQCEEMEKITLHLTEQIYRNMTDSNYIIYCLNRIRSNDEYTYTHSINTAFYSMLIGNWLNLPGKQLCELISASLLHDIGKTKIPNNILNKQGRLNKEEYEIVKEHSVLGYEIIKDSTAFRKELKEAVLLHHERMDGSGYPYGLKGKAIGLYARIISIADVYDAMTQNRIYKNKVSPFESFEMFQTEGVRLFDYPILYVFLKHIAPLYVGNKVRLSNGDVGEIVFIPPQDITSPILYINSEYMDLGRNNDIKVLQVI
jgi:putative nucleotidyltransferase with HDIG domain